MRLPTKAELILVALCIIAGFLVKAAWGSEAEKEAELRIVRTERDVLRRTNVVLRFERDEVDRKAAADSIARAAVIGQAETVAAEADTAGREVFLRIVEVVPDSVRELVVERERLHVVQIAQKDTIIVQERSASAVLRGQLVARDSLIVGLESDIALADDEIELLEDLRSPGLSTTESASIAVNTYFVSTEALGASTLEGLIIGGVTFVVLEGGSLLLDLLF